MNKASTTTTMLLSQRLDALAALGHHLLTANDEYLKAIMHRTHYNNSWFTIENQEQAIEAIARQFLDRSKLEAWLKPYFFSEETIQPQTVGLVMAGNLPLVGFHDWLCVFAAGHKAAIKLSDKDQYLLPYLFKLLTRFDPAFENYVQIVERLKNFDAVIATGSNNSARYFDAYFGKYPNIIRRNRNAVAVLTGKESPQELLELGKDVFQFFGMGCRSVAKLYVPRGYVFEPLLEALHEYRAVILHDKYQHNFEYNMAIFMLNRVPYMANGCVILLENDNIQSQIACLNYAYYDDLNTVKDELTTRSNEIQCVVGNASLPGFDTIPFGQAQQPTLSDYADGVDTMQFLLGLN